MSKIIIFGIKDTAQLAHYYLTNDSEHEVVGFTVNKEYKTINDFCGLPVISFEDIESVYNNKEYKMFAPMTGKNMNNIRKKVYNDIKNKGYEMISYISSKCTNLSEKIGDNCFILEDNTIQPFTLIGNNVVLWSGNHIGHHGIIRDHVFFTSHVVLSGHCDVGENSWFGVNCTIRDYAKISPYTLVAMGSLITKNTDEYGFYMGTPAKKQDKTSLEVY
jgi:sugar O-acyltransferase (sialic acid O-acetyltransferase NeuD family)